MSNRWFNLYYTGALPGEVIQSVPNKNNVKGSRMTILNGIKASKQALDLLNEDEWNYLILFMKERPFFESMSTKEIKNWLMYNSIDKDSYLLNEYDINVENVTLSGEDVLIQINEDDITKFGIKNPKSNKGTWTI